MVQLSIGLGRHLKPEARSRTTFPTLSQLPNIICIIRRTTYDNCGYYVEPSDGCLVTSPPSEAVSKGLTIRPDEAVGLITSRLMSGLEATAQVRKETQRLPPPPDQFLE